MSKPLKTFPRVCLLVFLVWCSAGTSLAYSATYLISREILNEGGANHFSTDNYKLCSSLGQPIAGTVNGAATKAFIGFWNPQVVLASDVNEEDRDHGNLPYKFCLHQNYPNPFNNSTVIQYDLPKASMVSIHIYNILGQKVITLVNQQQGAGYKTIYWNGRNNNGTGVGSGVYFYRIETDDFVKCKKMVLLK